MVVDILRLVAVHHQNDVIVLMFFPGTFADCNVCRIISLAFTVFDEALLKLAEEFVVIRIIVALREPDIIPHEEDFAVTVAHVSHDLIDLLQYRFPASERSGFIGHDGMALVLVFVGDSFVSHITVFLLLTAYSVFLSAGMSPR